MGTERALRQAMQALVLLNLIFVHLTEAAGMEWLAPLFGATLIAPLLERYRERLWYRAGWNIAVLSVFAVLILHILQGRAGRVLEGGLVLAALCQVHLLNNLRSSQRPDLLFFNAFLIAIVAGYLSNGIGFPVVFLAFVPSFVIGLQLLSVSTGGHIEDARVTHSIVRDGARRSLLLLVLSVAVFLGWPRDFQRKAFFHDKLDFGGDDASEMQVGFATELSLGRKGRVSASDREVLRVKVLDDPGAEPPELWRGATLSHTLGGSWTAAVRGADRGRTEPRWRGGRGGIVREGAGEVGARYEVLRHAEPTERLFLPLGAIRVQLTDEPHRRLRAASDATVELGGSEAARYTVELPRNGQPPLGGGIPVAQPTELAPFIELPNTHRVTRAVKLAEQLAQALPGDVPQHALVTAFSDYLSRRHSYIPPGGEGAAESLDSFLRGQRGGHCELFASALATMLRSRGVACRVVTGYRCGRRPSGPGQWAVLARDAHAWVEVHDPNGGWYAVDPTPALASDMSATNLLARWSAAARSAWARVTGFDATRRAEAIAWLRAQPAVWSTVIREQPSRLVLPLAVVCAGIVLLRRRRRLRTPVAIRRYRAALARAELQLLTGETPRELLERARSLELAPALIEHLEAATQAHEAERYARS